MNAQESWLTAIGHPENYDFQSSLRLIKKYSFKECNAELYLQANGPDTFQRVLKVFPKHFTGKLPAVAVPYYYPEAMLGFDLETQQALPPEDVIPLMMDLVKHGYMTASADAAHLTYLKTDRARGDFYRWPDFAQAIGSEHPEWTGIGKLTADTFLLIDALAGDPRVDADCIGIAGHSLGGKMAFYAGCLDSRIKAILANDFGMLWEQTNWNDPWYWGQKLEQLKSRGMDHAGLLGCAAPKPFCLIAGEYDNMESFAMMKRASGYKTDDDRLVIIHHGTGHRPPAERLNQGYAFLDKYLKQLQ